jgi:hypothetical protein
LADVAKLRLVFEGDTSSMDRAFNSAEKKLKDFSRRGKGEADITANTKAFDAAAARTQKKMSDIDGETITVDVDANTAGATANLMRFQATALGTITATEGLAGGMRNLSRTILAGALLASLPSVLLSLLLRVR